MKPTRVTSGLGDSGIRVFLNALCAGKPDELYVLIWTVRDKTSYWFRDAEEAIQFILSIAAHDVYIGVGFSPRNFGALKRCVAGEIAGIPGMWADIDIKSEAHPQPTLPSTIEQALSILPPEFRPTFVILTGNGIQAWWLFRELWIFENENDRCAAVRLAYRWQSMLRDNASQRGNTCDRLADLARLLRVPGTTNCKDSSNPKPVVIQSHSEYRYNPSELTEYLDVLGVADQEAEVRTAKNLAAPFRENPLKIDLSARIDEQRLKAWAEADSRFKATWFRQRHDLKDQTQSGYDQSLADFGVKAGLSDQEIVDLIVHHRAVHRQKLRTNVNYFELTISKARANSMVKPDWFSETAGRQTSEPANSVTFPAAGKSDQEKIQLCKNISAALGIEVLRMVKVSGDNPLYRMELAAGSVSFPGVDKLIGKSAVRNAIAGKAAILIPEFKTALWRNLVQMMLDACIDEDGGEELESQGAARLCIRQYLAETTFIPGIAGQLPQDLRKPMVLDDQIAVCASDLHLYLTRTRPAISVSMVVAALSAAGAKVKRVRGKFKEQSRWKLPLDEFDPADYASSMPGGSTEHE